MKAYIHVREDVATAAALATLATANPTAFPLGAMYVTADGAVSIVQANDGTTVTWGSILAAA